jgi:hypothetical protein
MILACPSTESLASRWQSASVSRLTCNTMYVTQQSLASLAASAGVVDALPPPSFGIGSVVDPLRPPPTTANPSLVTDRRDSVVIVAQRQAQYALTKAEYSDNVLKMIDSFCRRPRMHMTFQYTTRSLFLLALYPLDVCAAPQSEPYKLYPSTIVIIPPMHSIRMLDSEVIIPLHRFTGRNFSKFESFFLHARNIHVVPYAEIAQDNPGIAAMRDAIEKTVVASMEPPLQLKSLYDVILEEVNEQSPHPGIRLKPPYGRVLAKGKGKGGAAGAKDGGAGTVGKAADSQRGRGGEDELVPARGVRGKGELGTRRRPTKINRSTTLKGETRSAGGSEDEENHTEDEAGVHYKAAEVGRQRLEEGAGCSLGRAPAAGTGAE